ncbi:MAG: hypothetical protein ACI9LY_001257, partial [Arenicella sp.]
GSDEILGWLILIDLGKQRVYASFNQASKDTR